jgi:hypothetical protein
VDHTLSLHDALPICTMHVTAHIPQLVPGALPIHLHRISLRKPLIALR